ncbi:MULTISPECIES: hypothetical protein [unclassified Isoptericola]|uniref:hypothetical protein n=1 Tax=unclassified Isoptericola TaxID=2623355 RepID=UPI0036564A24
MTPGSADGRALTRQLLGTLGFSAAAERVPGLGDLPELHTSAVPDGWRERSAAGTGLRLALPDGWAETPAADGTAWSAGGHGETVTVATRTGDAPRTVPPTGYRYDVPGADAAVIRVGDSTTDDGEPCFLGSVELRRGDGTVSLEYSGPRGAASQERFGSIVRSLGLSGG